VEYRQWGYDERSPRDRGSAQTWSTQDDTSEHGTDGWWFTPVNDGHSTLPSQPVSGYPLPSQPVSGHPHDPQPDYPPIGYDEPGAERDEWHDDGYATGQWGYRDRSGTWPEPEGWLPRPRATPPVQSDWGEHTGEHALRRPYEMVHYPAAEPLDDDVESERRQLPSVLMTLVWYAAPIVLYLLWALVLGGSPDPNCTDSAGNPCPAPRDEALTTIVDSAPRLATALALSLVVAIILRWITSAWRAATVGFASAVVGAGIATVIFSVLSRTA